MPATLSNQLPLLNNYSIASYFAYMSNVPKWIPTRQSDYIDSGGTRLQLVSCSRDSLNHNPVYWDVFYFILLLFNSWPPVSLKDAMEPAFHSLRVSWTTYPPYHGPFRVDLPVLGEHFRCSVGIDSLVFYPSCAPTHCGSTRERIPRFSGYQHRLFRWICADLFIESCVSKDCSCSCCRHYHSLSTDFHVVGNGWTGTPWTSQILQLATWVSDNAGIPVGHGNG